jgi:dipeptidyl aminopeptidase/acylaminoacyl peptidase
MFQRARGLSFAVLVLSLVGKPESPAFGQPEATGTEVVRSEVGNRVTEDIPPIPPELAERLARYQNTRRVAVAGWTKGGCLLIGTRFADTQQVHRVCQPMGMREQLTFHTEPVGEFDPAPVASTLDGFVFARDKGGDEFSQLHWFDLATRQTTLLTDGKRSQNGQVVFSRDGRRMAWSSTARNGTDTDVWVRDGLDGAPRALVVEGGRWSAQDFSPDAKSLLVMKRVSAEESYPGLVDVATGKLEMFPVDGGKASFGSFKFAPDGHGVYYLSDEIVGGGGGAGGAAGKVQEWKTLRHHDPASGKLEILSASIPWDVVGFEISPDGKHLGFVSNEDAISRVHVLELPSHRELALAGLPEGVVDSLSFSADGRRVALTIDHAKSASDAYVLDLAPGGSLVRWTASEVGGLDAEGFVAPTLVRYPTFDRDPATGKARTVPAFYYRPRRSPTSEAGGKFPVVINIHGGPEGQALPTFNPLAQFLVREMGVAVLVPNVRGSSGYGKTYLGLDNAAKREDSVKDIGALLDWVGSQPELDATRVAVRGGSYGGYMVLASLLHYGDRIRAGVDYFGISDFETFLTNTESYRRDARRQEYGDERDPAMREVFARISPARHVDRLRSRLFVAQGKNDPRVPWSESEQIVKAVRANGRPVWYVLFADEGHGFRKKVNSDYFDAATMLFLERHLIGSGGS